MLTLSRTRIAATAPGLLLAVALAAASSPAASAATTHPAAAAHVAANSQDDGLQAQLEALGLSVQIYNGYIGASGPAAAVSLACTLLGTSLRHGALAFYTGHDETGNGNIVFTGDSDPANFYFGLTGAVVDNFQNCTNQTWSVSNFVPNLTLPITGATTDATDTPGQDQNIVPTGDAVAGDTSSLNGEIIATFVLVYTAYA